MTELIQLEPIDTQIAEAGYCFVEGWAHMLGGLASTWQSLAESWNRLPRDNFMPDGGAYRRRRFGRFAFFPDRSQLIRLGHSTFTQSTEINTFAGGIERNFDPLEENTFVHPLLHALVRSDFLRFGIDDCELMAKPREVKVHQIRIEATNGNPETPTPEGIHSDGHEFIAIHLINRENLSGGKSIICDIEGHVLETGLLTQPLDSIYINDRKVMHGVSPVKRIVENAPARRDVLLIDFDIAKLRRLESELNKALRVESADAVLHLDGRRRANGLGAPRFRLSEDRCQQIVPLLPRKCRQGSDG